MRLRPGAAAAARGRTRCGFVAAGFLAALAAAACERHERRPSFVLAVLDTTRADAISAYGDVRDTSPAIDALARTGLRYSHAYSNVNWTLPSHATLFTGLLPRQHGVRCARDTLDDGITTLAERLHDAGYETVGVSENPWLGEASRLTRGFDRFSLVRPFGSLQGRRVVSVRDEIGEWLSGRRDTRPFFLFVNLMDSHDYPVLEVNRYLPPGTSGEEARRTLTGAWGVVCTLRTGDPGAALIRGLYLNGVQAADTKLAGILRQLTDGPAGGDLVTIVTSDHGEYLGEHGLLGHDTGLGHPVLHVPLIVHGLPGVAPALIDEPVQLADVMPSILAWAAVAEPDGLAGKPLPARATGAHTQRMIVAEYRDPDACENVALVHQAFADRRSACGPEDRVLGDARVAIRLPWELVTYERYPPALFDLDADPREEHDVAATAAETLAALRTAVDGIIAAMGAPRAAQQVEIEPERLERLRALGYLGGPPAPSPDAR